MHKPIQLLKSPVLRKRAKLVTKKQFGSDELLSIIKNLSDTLRTTEEGVGLAAPQIGISLRIFVASEEALAIDSGNESPTGDESSRKKKKTWKHYVFINPELVNQSSKKQTTVEGCLSIPKKYGLVTRAEKVRVRAYDEMGKKFERGTSKLFARLMQHEIDHLNGILYIDKAKDIVDIDEKKS